MDKYEEVLALWQSKNIITEGMLAQALSGYDIAFAYNSGKIENANITFRDTCEIFDRDGVVSYTGDLRTLYEIRNAKEAYEFFLVSYGKRRRLDEWMVKRMQYLLTQNTYDGRRYQIGERPGEYKKHDYVTGREEVGAAPEDVAEEMDELFDELLDIPSGKALTAAAYFHAKFENIHPFAEGNGRTGRLAMNYLLVTNGHPPVTVHEEDRNGYYLALEAWDKRQDLTPLKDFLTWQVVKTWEKKLVKEKGYDL